MATGNEANPLIIDLPLDAYVADFIEEIKYTIDCISSGMQVGTRALEGSKSGDTLLVDIKG